MGVRYKFGNIMMKFKRDKMIKKILFIMFLSSIFFLNLANGVVQNGKLKLVIKRISDKVITVEHEFGSSSQMVIISKKGLVVFGSHVSVSMAREYLDSIKGQLGRDDVVYLINNSGRIIKSGGNAAFKHATIISTDEVFKSMNRDSAVLEEEIQKSIKGWKWKLEKAKEQLSKLDPNSPRLGLFREWVTYCQRLVHDLSREEYQVILPQIVYSNQITLNMGDVTVSMNKYGFTFIKEEGILFASNFFHPAHFSNYFHFAPVDKTIDVPEVLEMLTETFYNKDIKVVYSGFAGVMPLQDILKRIDYYKKLWHDILSHVNEKKSFQYIHDILSLDKKYSWVKKWKMYQSNKKMVNEEHEHNLKLFWNSTRKL